jgi:asparagine synthase (glutamine-hydrolysing)
MPGVLGIIQPHVNRKVEARLMQKMIQPLIHHPWYRCARAHLPGAAIGLVSLGILAPAPHCLTSENGRQLLAFEGELYNTNELLRALGINYVRGDACEIQASLVLRAMRRWGTGALERFNGIFQLALWDADQQELILASDPGGLQPIYLAQRDDMLAFAPEVKALLQLPPVSREIDYQAILTFLQHGHTLGNSTFFRDVKVLPGGCYARFHHGQLDIQRYWRMKYAEKSSLKNHEIHELFLDTWKDVMRRQSGGDLRLGSLLSGGLDSRLILAELVCGGKMVSTFTTGKPGSEDSYIAREVSKALNCPNSFIPATPDNPMQGLEWVVYLTDGMFNCFHADIRHLLPSLAGTVEVVFDGISATDCFYNTIEVPF